MENAYSKIPVRELKAFFDWQRRIEKQRAFGKMSKKEQEYLAKVLPKVSASKLFEKFNLDFEAFLRNLPQEATNNIDKKDELENAFYEALRKAHRYNYRLRDGAVQNDTLTFCVMHNFLVLLSYMASQGFVYVNILKYAHVMRVTYLQKLQSYFGQKGRSEKQTFKRSAAWLGSHLSQPGASLKDELNIE